jgi:hypothetical protein
MSRTRLAVMTAALLAAASAHAQPAAPPAGPAPQGGPGGLCNAPCDPYPNMKKLLIVADVQSGFHHASLNHTMAVLEQLGRKAGVYVSFLRTDSQLITKQPIKVTSARYARGNTNIRNLDYFDAVMILGSGEGTMTDAQKADLLSFVRDDGKGMDATSGPIGMGLSSMRERARAVGGRLEIVSAPGQGCSVTLRLALSALPCTLRPVLREEMTV